MTLSGHGSRSLKHSWSTVGWSSVSTKWTSWAVPLYACSRSWRRLGPVWTVLSLTWRLNLEFAPKLVSGALSVVDSACVFAFRVLTYLLGEIILSDIIDSDSWRLWKKGDPRLRELSKQVYRDAENVTGELLQQVKLNFQWVADKADVSVVSRS